MCLPNLSLTSSKVRERGKRTWRMILWGGSRCSSTLSNRHEKISISISICKSWSLKTDGLETDGLEFRSEPNIQNSSMGVTGEMWALHHRSDLFPCSWHVAYKMFFYGFPWKSLFSRVMMAWSYLHLNMETQWLRWLIPTGAKDGNFCVNICRS